MIVPKGSSDGAYADSGEREAQRGGRADDCCCWHRLTTNCKRSEWQFHCHSLLAVTGERRLAARALGVIIQAAVLQHLQCIYPNAWAR